MDNENASTGAKCKKIVLSVKDRIQFPTILPETGDFIKMSLREAILKKIELTQKEIQEYEIKGTVGDAGKMFFDWNDEKAKDIEFEFASLEIDLIQLHLNSIEKEGTLNEDSFRYYKMFVKNLEV